MQDEKIRIERAEGLRHGDELLLGAHVVARRERHLRLVQRGQLVGEHGDRRRRVGERPAGRTRETAVGEGTRVAR